MAALVPLLRVFLRKGNLRELRQNYGPVVISITARPLETL